MKPSFKIQKFLLPFILAGVAAGSLFLNGCGVTDYLEQAVIEANAADTQEPAPVEPEITEEPVSEPASVLPDPAPASSAAAAKTHEPSGIDPELDEALQERLTVDLIEKSEYSRPGDELKEINGIVVHYLGNPGTTGQENRDYFNSLAESGAEYASCHFVIGLEGEIIQLIPTDEIAYCSNDANADTISIECCHPDSTGVFTDETFDSLVLLCAWLCEKYDLTYEDIIRHYDVTGKFCPLAFVESADYYYRFKAAVANAMNDPVTAGEIAESSDDEFDPDAGKKLEEDSYAEEHFHGPDGGRRRPPE